MTKTLKEAWARDADADSGGIIMREIKFRAWDKEEQEMLDWDKFFNLDIAQVFESKGSWGVYPMQYTGLKDKNGVEIYDGSIIRFVLGDYNIREYVEEVVYSDGAFWCGNWLLFDAKMNDDNLEVLGNIYENPELLEGNQ